MSTQKRFELGVDYEGVSKRHLQVNEEIIFSNEEASRIFMPECGSFYVESLIIKDKATGKELTLGIDYDVFILDAKATKESGKQACGMIVVKNPSIGGVLLDYQFVGGLHSSGYYVLEQMMKMYPKGTSAIISFDEVLNKPDEFDPAYHTQHVSEFFKTDNFVVTLEKLRQGIHNRQNKLLETMYAQATATINAMYSKLESANTRLTAEIAEVLKSISIQSDEYILTDSAENPAVERGYGNWVLITNTILRGGPAGNFLIGSGSLIAMGSDQIIRNCYIWYNKQDSSVNEAKITVTSNKEFISEGEQITFTLTATNIPNGTIVDWFFDGIDAGDLRGWPNGTGSITINNGTATLTFQPLNDRKTEGNESFVFRVRDYPNAFKQFTVLDTSTDRRITALNFLNSSNQVIDNVTEDSKFKLRIATTGMIGQNIYLNWSSDVAHLAAPPPTVVNITANVVYVALETIGNLTPNITRILEVKALESADEVIDETTPKTTVYILDTSQELVANVVFLNENDLIVTNIDEDSTFKIKVRTNGGVGQKLKVTYRSNRPLSEFDGLLPEVTIASDNTAIIAAQNIANYLTATETEFLEVTIARALDGRVLTSGTVLLNDTTKNPNFIVNTSSSPTGEGNVTTVNEGDNFYLVFKVPGWVGSVTPPTLDIILDFEGSPSITSRLQFPNKLSNVRFDEYNGVGRIEWLNGDTLAIHLTAIADKAIHGNAVVKVRWKMSLATTYNTGPTITIIDTSKPTLTASWSSSATELSPITSVNEMQTNGGDNACYLWLDVDGDGSTFTNLQLGLSSNTVANAGDLIQIYPRSLSIAKGSNHNVVRVDILADFLNEGNENLAVEVTAAGFAAPLVKAALTVVDNSVSIPITFNRPASTIHSNGTYSEWEDVTITVNLQPLAFDTVLVVSAIGNEKIDGLVLGNINIPANQSVHTITIAAKKIRHETGNYAVTIKVKRMFGAKTVSPETSLVTNFTNDRLFPSIESLSIYSNPEGTIAATAIPEGGSCWVKVVVQRPIAGMAVVIGNSVNTAADSGNKAGTNRFIFANNRKVNLKPAETRGSVATTLSQITAPLDRTTNPVGLMLELAAKIDWSANGSALALNSSYTESLTVNNAEQRVTTKSVTVNDTSKTSAVTGFTSATVNGTEVTTFDEGARIYFNFNIDNPTIGDIYNLELDASSQVKTNRFVTHQFSSRDVTMTNNTRQGIQFEALLSENFITDGLTTGNVTLRNKTTGTEALKLNFTVNDTSKRPTISAVWVDTNGTPISSVNEGSAFLLRVTTANINPANSAYSVRTHDAVGRAASEFDSYQVDTYVDVANNFISDFRFSLKENFKTDSVNTFAVKATIHGLPENVPAVTVTSPTLVINDTSKAPTYSVTWKSGNTAIDSTTEGTTVNVEVITRGVSLGSQVVVTLSGTGITASDVDQLSKTSILQALGETGNGFVNPSWTFSNDLLTEGTETVTATATINGVVIGSDSIAILDTSTTTPTFSAYFTSDAAGNNRITQANEGDTVYAICEAAHLTQDLNSAWDISGTTGGSTGDGTYQVFSPLSGNVVLKNGRNAVKLLIPINYITTGDLITGISFLLPSPLNNRINTPNLNIIDLYQTPTILDVVWSKNVKGHDPISSANPGEEFYLVVITRNVTLGQQIELSFPVMDDITVADFDYGPFTGTRNITVSQYDEATKEGYATLACKLKAAAIPEVIKVTESTINYANYQSVHSGDNYDDRDDYDWLAFGKHTYRTITTSDPEWRVNGTSPTTEWDVYHFPKLTDNTYTFEIAHSLNNSAPTMFGFTIVHFYLSAGTEDYWNNTDPIKYTYDGCCLYTTSDLGTTTELWIKFSGGDSLKLTRKSLTNGFGVYEPAAMTAAVAYAIINGVNAHYTTNKFTTIEMSKKAL